MKIILISAIFLTITAGDAKAAPSPTPTPRPKFSRLSQCASQADCEVKAEKQACVNYHVFQKKNLQWWLFCS